MPLPLTRRHACASGIAVPGSTIFQTIRAGVHDANVLAGFAELDKLGIWNGAADRNLCIPSDDAVTSICCGFEVPCAWHDNGSRPTRWLELLPHISKHRALPFDIVHRLRWSSTGIEDSGVIVHLLPLSRAQGCPHGLHDDSRRLWNLGSS